MSAQDSELGFTQNKKYNRKLFESQNAQKLVLDHIFLFNDSRIVGKFRRVNVMHAVIY